MKFQTFYQLRFTGVQLMRPMSWIFAVLPARWGMSSSISVQQVTHTTSIPLALASLPFLLLKVGLWEPPSSVEPCVSPLPASQAGEWSLVAREETAAKETSLPPQGSADSSCCTCTTAPHRFPPGWATAGRAAQHCPTAASALCRRDLNRADVFWLGCGPGLCFVCLSAAAKSFPQTWQ